MNAGDGDSSPHVGYWNLCRGAGAVALPARDHPGDAMNTYAVFSVHPAILQFELKIRYLSDREITGIFTEDGESILTLHAVETGNGFFTVIPEELKKQIKDSILTHNHPSGCSFTKRDLKEASFFSLKEIRVVGRTGVYSMKPGVEGWPAPNVITKCFSRIEDDPDFQVEIVTLSCRDRRFTDAGTGPLNIAGIRSDRLCERLAAALNLTYQRYVWR